MVIGTKELRKSKLISKNKVIKITVAGHEVVESTSERLLGMIINNTMTWEHHLFGNEEHKGLVPKLSQRSGIINKLSFIMPKDKLRIFAEGLFFSLLNYCIEVYGNVWGLDTYDEEDRQSTSFRKEDIMKLQVIVNKVLRSLTGLARDTPISVLCSSCGQLSRHQRVALFTLTSIHKALSNKEPAHSYRTLHSVPNPGQPVRLQTNCNRVDYDLSISRGSYYYRGSRLYNQIPSSLANMQIQAVFKTDAKQWVKSHIPLLPP